MTIDVAAAMFNALKGGQSVVMSILGDSTGVGSTRWPHRLAAEKIGPALPGVHIVKEDWDDATQGYLARTVIQAASGPRHVIMDGGHTVKILGSDLVARTSADFELMCKIAMDDWTPAAQKRICGVLGSAGNRGWYLILNTNGTLQLSWSADGTNLITSNQSSAIPISDGAAAWVRARLDVDNGSGGWTVTIDVSADERATWTNLLTQATSAGTTSIFASTADFDACGASGSARWTGKLYDMILRDGINGPARTPISIEAFFDQDTPPLLSLGGSPTLYIQNGSMSGGGIVSGNDYLTDITRFPKMLGFSPVHVVVCNTGQNDTPFRSSARMYTTWASWVAQIRSRSPLSAVLGTNQNRRNVAITSGGSASDSYRQQARAMLMMFARLCIGGIDTMAAADRAVAAGATEADLSTDGIHETDLGVTIRINEMWRVLSKGLVAA